MSLRLDVQKRIMTLTMPERLSEKKALLFAQANKEWINQKIAELPPVIHFKEGQSIPVFGDNILIKIKVDPSYKRTSFKFEHNELYVFTNKNEPESRIQSFLKEEAKKAIKDLANEKAEKIGKPISAISIRDTKSRWGSCSSDGRLSFSWRLIFAPFESLDYVVAHEVAHLIHMNHNPDFWALCKKLSTDYSTGKSWIKQNGESLMCYGSV